LQRQRADFQKQSAHENSTFSRDKVPRALCRKVARSATESIAIFAARKEATVWSDSQIS